MLDPPLIQGFTKLIRALGKLNISGRINFLRVRPDFQTKFFSNYTWKVITKWF